MPGLSAKEAATNKALDLVDALTKPIDEEKLQALRQLVEIFKQQTDPTKPLRNKATSPRMEETIERPYNNPPKKYKYPRVKIISDIPTPAPTTRLIPRQ